MNRIITQAFIWITGFLMVPPAAWPHGEDRLGPNGGYIRMPGAFHTELKSRSGRELVVYLLDLHWKNPEVRDSSVTLELSRRGRIESVSCKVVEKYFLCRLPKSWKELLPGDQVTVTAIRMGEKGASVTYSYPFELMSVHP